MTPAPYYVAILHDRMADKTGKIVTTSVTLIDVHDIARSSTTYGVRRFYVVHPSEIMRGLVGMIKSHWDEGFGLRYNPNRKEALDCVVIRDSLESVIEHIKGDTGLQPLLVATSARAEGTRVTFSKMKAIYESSEQPVLLLFGTGWGMSEDLMSRADYTIEPILGPTPYNHLSVRAAVAIVLDRIFGR